MKTPSISSVTFVLVVLLVILSCSIPTALADGHDKFLECLSTQSRNYSFTSAVVYTPSNSSYSSVLRFSIRNPRFDTLSTPKPQYIITPEQESQIPPVVLCAKQNGLEIRIRSGGHDFEGLSYVSPVPFVIIDMIKLSEITVDVETKTAWVGSGATIGMLYYNIFQKSPTLGFPAGFCPTVGVGGQFGGGGYGPMLRKHGLAADNVIDARIVDVNGRILDRKAMGEGLFWAIRGGGPASFGVVTAWKIKLVDVPEKVTVFLIQRTLEQNATRLALQWQTVANEVDPDLFIGLSITRTNTTITAAFFSLFLGGIDRLLPLMQKSFPELGLVRSDCTEMSWGESTVYYARLPLDKPEDLLNRSVAIPLYSKINSDYVKKPLPRFAFEGLWKLYHEPEAEVSEHLLIPYGGRMAEISESAIPFPHRGGNLYMMSNYLTWTETKADNTDRYISWSRRVYNYVTPFVSRFPRAAYMNYRDLDIGENNEPGKTSYEQASIWGLKYLKRNFHKLVLVKTMVDPQNFFRFEQSIPPLYKDED